MRNYINGIKLENWKGRSAKYALKPLTVIVGQNQRGKSAIVQAICVGLLTHSPKHGKAASATFGFVGNHKGTTEGRIELDMANGKESRLGWSSRGDKVKLTIDGSYNGDEPVPKEMLDIGEFLKKSGPDRTRHVFSLIDLDEIGFSLEKVTAILKRDIKVESPTQESEQAISEIVALAEHKEKERVKANHTRQDWFESLFISIKAKRDNGQAVLDAMAGMAQGTARLAAAEGAKAFFDPAKLEQCDRKVSEIELAIHDVQTLIESNRKKAIERGIQEKIISGGQDWSKDIAKSEKTIAAFQKTLGGWVSKLPGISEQLLKARSDQANLNAAIKSKIEQIDKLRQDLEEIENETCCTRCKSKGKGWKASFTEFVEKEIAGLESGINPSKEQLMRVVTLAEQLNNEAISARKEELEIEEQRRQMQTLQTNVNGWRKQMTAVDASKSRLQGIGEVGDVPAMIESANVLSMSLNEAKRLLEIQKQAQREEIAAKADRRRIEEANANHAKNLASVEVCKLALKCIDQIKATMKDKVFGDFMEIICKFTDGIITDCDGKKVALEYREGEIGYWYGATWVAQPFFSGTQDMLTNIGLAIALAQGSSLKLVVVDEWLGSRETRQQVRERFADLITAEVIDQAIIIDVEKAPYIGAKGIELIDLSETKRGIFVCSEANPFNKEKARGFNQVLHPDVEEKTGVCPHCLVKMNQEMLM